MKPKYFKGFTNALGQPLDYDEIKHGICGELPTMKLDEYFFSYWTMSFWERLKLIFGADIQLRVMANRHPPVNLSVNTIKTVKKENKNA